VIRDGSCDVNREVSEQVNEMLKAFISAYATYYFREALGEEGDPQTVVKVSSQVEPDSSIEENTDEDGDDVNYLLELSTQLIKVLAENPNAILSLLPQKESDENDNEDHSDDDDSNDDDD
jgi:hypothetical protein